MSEISHQVTIVLSDDRIRLEEGHHGIFITDAGSGTAVIPWGMLDAVLVAVDYIAKAHK